MDKSETALRERNTKSESNGFHSNGVSSDVQAKKTLTKSRSQLQLISSPSLPHFLTDNEYLLHYHRPQIPSIMGCMESAFHLHTETINIWSHLIGSIGSLIIMIHHYAFTDIDIENSMWHLPFFLGAITCMGTSAIYHTFLCYSENVHRCLAKFDYCGIILLIVSSFPPWLHLGFYCDKWVRNMYLVLIYSMGLICSIVIMYDGLGKKDKHFRTIRAALFMVMGLSGLVPGLHFFYVGGYELMMHYGSWLIIMAFWYLAGGVIYAMRIPEKLSPGKYDIFMHSHQFLHMFVIMGVICCFIGISGFAQYRKQTHYYCPGDAF